MTDQTRPFPHLRALIAETGASLRQLAIARGIDYNQLSYILKPSNRVESMPGMPVVKRFALALDVEPWVVAEAMAADLGYPWGPPEEQDPDERALLRNYRRATPADKVTLLRVSESLTGGDEPPQRSPRLFVSRRNDE